MIFLDKNKGMKRILVLGLFITGFALRIAAQVPAMPNLVARKAVLEREWAAIQTTPSQLGVRDWFLFLVDALDTRFLKDEQVEWLLKKVQTRVINSPAAGRNYGNIFWGWNETGFDVGDGNNVQFCVQYGIMVKLLFNDRLSKEAAKTLDEIFALATNGVLNQEVRISYANIYLMKVWNLIALGEVYHQPNMLENGRRLFNQWLSHTAQYGIREYDSPTYSAVNIESLLLMYTFSKDADIKTKAGDALNFLITDLSGHYNKRAGILAGAHSRDYNRVFSRDLLEEKYFNPLLGSQNKNTHLFHQICLSALQKLGLSTAQKELMNRENRFIVQRWDSLAHTYASNFVGNKVSIASSNQAYSPDDKPFVMYLSSPRIPAMPNIAFVMEGRDDHYGTWGATGMGEKMKSRMPANYPANGGWGKTRHLMPFMQSAQNKGEFVMLVSGQKDHNCINDYLNSTIILPNAFDEIWMGNKRINVPDIGSGIEMDTTKTFFAKFEDVAIAFRLIWDDAGEGVHASLYNDGFNYQSSREEFQLKHNKTMRLTLRHSNNGKAAIAMWWKTEEGVKTAADFLKFRKKVLTAPLIVNVQNDVIEIAVMTAAGKLGVKADMPNKKRLTYYNPSPLPTNFLYNVDGVEIGKPIMEKYKAKKVVLDNFYNKETHPKTGKPFHYLWTDTAMSGFSQLGELFKANGTEISTLAVAPSALNLKGIDVYLIVDPDTKAEADHPNFITERDALEIVQWVKDGGVLLMLANDFKNAELDSFNILAGKFGMHFNNDQLHPVTKKEWETGASKNLPTHPLFKNISKIYLKEVSSITCANGAKPVLTENNNVLMAENNFGKGYVFAIGDPWIYNEYIDHWLLPADFENMKAAKNLVELLLNKTKKNKVQLRN